MIVYDFEGYCDLNFEKFVKYVCWTTVMERIALIQLLVKRKQ